jgi:hypothetical protein
LVTSLFVAKSILIVQYLETQAWWRLDSAGHNALRVARNVVSLLDAAAFLRDISDDHPAIAVLDAAGCFQDDTFDPGPEGAVVVRGWQLADEQSGGPVDLLYAMVAAAGRTPPGGPLVPIQRDRPLIGDAR